MKNVTRKPLEGQNVLKKLLKIFVIANLCVSSLIINVYAMDREGEVVIKNLKIRNGEAYWGDDLFPYDCNWGRNGTIQAKDKREGDGKTPECSFFFRRVFYRDDRIENIETCLPLQKIVRGDQGEGGDGWCDDPSDLHYNEVVTLPYKGSHEVLWREDNLYDIILSVGYNDSPVISDPPMGSAIFVHLGVEGKATEGCVSLNSRDALLRIIKEATPNRALNARR